LKTVLSVDVAKNKSMIMLMNSDGEIFIDTKEINHNLEDFEKVKEEIKEINPQNLTVFMESTGTYHLPVERYFKENGFNTLVINSLTTKNNYDTIRKTKTDKKDCYRLAKLFFVNEVEYHDLSKKDLYANLKAMTRQYFYLLQNNVSCKNRYKRLINICFPELEKIFKSTRIYDDTALNFIKEFPYAEIVKEKRIDALYNNLYKTNGRNLNFYKKLATTIKQSGKSINVKGAISKRGNKYARYILFNCSQMVVKLGASNYPEHPVYIYYQNKKAEGKHYYESLTACSTKILRMLYSMCKNNKQFLEN
jgi:transposase